MAANTEGTVDAATLTRLARFFPPRENETKRTRRSFRHALEQCETTYWARESKAHENASLSCGFRFSYARRGGGDPREAKSHAHTHTHTRTRRTRAG